MGLTPQLVPECALQVQKGREGATCQWLGVVPQDTFPPQEATLQRVFQRRYLLQSQPLETPPPPITTSRGLLAQGLFSSVTLSGPVKNRWEGVILF